MVCPARALSYGKSSGNCAQKDQLRFFKNKDQEGHGFDLWSCFHSELLVSHELKPCYRWFFPSGGVPLGYWYPLWYRS